MKLEAGMHVRINDDFRQVCIGIGKIKNIAQDTVCVHVSNNNLPISFSKDKISKSSHSIIDLIEVGDYVNGCRVIEVIDTDTRHYLRIDVQFQNSIYESEIKSIVTKEQFEKMTYKVGD